VDSTSILIRYTRGADADLNGVCNDDDVTIVAALYTDQNYHAWYYGDFDYSGLTNGPDDALMAQLYNPLAAPLPFFSDYKGLDAAQLSSSILNFVNSADGSLDTTTATLASVKKMKEAHAANSGLAKGHAYSGRQK
jgi:hypothetical protein